MPPYYDVYGISKHRDRKTIECFLSAFCHRGEVESQEGTVIGMLANEKYRVAEIELPVNTLTEVVDFGLQNSGYGFSFYIASGLINVKMVILKFTYDGLIIFGVSIEEMDDNWVDNLPKARELAVKIARLTQSYKTSIQFECGTADDAGEFEEDHQLFSHLNNDSAC